MIESDPERSVDTAFGFLKQALDQWSSGDPSRLAACEVLVEQSVAQMMTTEKALQAGYVATPDLRRKLVSLKAGVAQATRIVDSGTAFYGGMISQLGGLIQTYNAAGECQAFCPRMQSEVVG